jgi:hypothetical protein
MVLTASFDQLRGEQALDRIDNLHRTPNHASSPSSLAFWLNVLLQRVT